MSFINRWQHRLRALFQSEATRREREAEIAFHLALEASDRRHEGLTADEAEREARRVFGNTTAIAEQVRGVSRMKWLDVAMQDLRYAVRSLRRSPGYAIGAAATLAIGIGATTAVFSIFDTLVLRGVPYANAGRIYMAIERNAKGGFRTPSYPTFRDWQADSAAWQGSIDAMAFVRGRGVWIDGENGADRVLVAHVTPGFFDIMKAKPELGRTFRPDEELVGGERIAVLSFDVWHRYYHGDTAIVGKVVDIDSSPTRIIGVMPHAFVYPQWTAGRSASTGMWMPIAHIIHTDATLAKRGDHADSRTIIRVRADADSTRAATVIAGMGARLANVYPKESSGWTQAVLVSIRNEILGNVTQLLRTIGGAVALVLLLACINVANLTFVRGTARGRELAVRAALGAGRSRVIRQLLTESLVIGIVSAMGGVLLASAILSVTRMLAANQLIGAQDLAINGTMLTFAIGVSLVAAMGSAIAPAFRATRMAPIAAARGTTQTSTSGRRDSRIRSGLVVAQLSLAVVLLVGTGLLVRSFRNVIGVPLAYDPIGLIETRVTPPARYAEAGAALGLYRTVLDRLKTIPGVTDAAFTNDGRMSTPVAVEGGELRADVGSTIAPHYHTVSASYFATMKMTMAAGRPLSEDDMRTRDNFVVNEALAHQLFPDGNALGRRITAIRAMRARPEFGQPATGTIVGVVRDAPSQTGDGAPSLDVYAPFTLDVWPWGSLYVRTTGDVTRAIPLVRDALRNVDPAIPEARASARSSGAGALIERIADATSQRELVLWAVAAFALCALLLAAIGLYSVISYGVTLRTREVGVRIALGATRGTIVRLVLGEGTRLAVLGVLIGCVAAVGATRVIRGMLFRTTTTDVATYLVTAGVLLVTASIACYLPARRAARLSASEAIRGG